MWAESGHRPSQHLKHYHQLSAYSISPKSKPSSNAEQLDKIFILVKHAQTDWSQRTYVRITSLFDVATSENGSVHLIG